MQMANFGGSKGPRRILRCGGVIWEGKGVNEAWLTYERVPMIEFRFSTKDIIPSSRTSYKLRVSLEVYDFDMC